MVPLLTMRTALSLMATAVLVERSQRTLIPTTLALGAMAKPKSVAFSQFVAWPNIRSALARLSSLLVMFPGFVQATAPIPVSLTPLAGLLNELQGPELLDDEELLWDELLEDDCEDELDEDSELELEDESDDEEELLSELLDDSDELLEELTLDDDEDERLLEDELETLDDELSLLELLDDRLDDDELLSDDEDDSDELEDDETLLLLEEDSLDDEDELRLEEDDSSSPVNVPAVKRRRRRGPIELK